MVVVWERCESHPGESTETSDGNTGAMDSQGREAGGSTVISGDNCSPEE